MATFFRQARRALLLRCHRLQSRNSALPQWPSAFHLLPSSSHNQHFQKSMSHIAEMRNSAFRENLLRILRKEIDYEINVRHPREPIKQFETFIVEDRPGKQYIQLRKKHGDKEDIKVDVTMFDGFTSSSPDTRNDDPGGDMKLHISLVVDVKKFEGDNVLQFVCSAWPETLVIQKVFLYQLDPPPLRPFMGPDFKEMDEELQEAFMTFLEERGIDDNLAVFLHDYIANKDVCENVHWLGNIKAYIEKLHRFINVLAFASLVKVLPEKRIRKVSSRENGYGRTICLVYWETV